MVAPSSAFLVTLLLRDPAADVVPARVGDDHRGVPGLDSVSAVEPGGVPADHAAVPAPPRAAAFAERWKVHQEEERPLRDAAYVVALRPIGEAIESQGTRDYFSGNGD